MALLVFHWAGTVVFPKNIFSFKALLFLIARKCTFAPTYTFMAKQPSFSDNSTTASKPEYDRLNIDALLGLIDAAFDGLVESRSTDYQQDDFIERAFHLGSVILEASKKSARRRSSVHNSSVWPLPTDLTIKVFSMLDTRSTFSMAATCLFFRKCAVDPFCYTNIDLVNIVPELDIDYETKVPRIKDAAAVSSMIEATGNDLQSIKLGVRSTDGAVYTGRSTLGCCLSSLSANGGASGSRLRRLHLYNIENIKDAALSEILSVCPSLVDLELLCLDVHVSDTLESVSRHCRLVERFIFQLNTDACRYDELDGSACRTFVLNCPNITTLALQACQVSGSDVCNLVKGFHELKYVDFTYSSCYFGSLTKNLVSKGGVDNLEVMILRDCYKLGKVEVKNFMKALLAGKFKLLRHLDISNSDGLAYNGKYDDTSCDASFIPVERLLQQRPNLCLVAEFGDRKSSSHTS